MTPNDEKAPLSFEFEVNEEEFVRVSMRLSRQRLRRSVLIFGGLAAGYTLMVVSEALPREWMVWMLPVVYGVNALTVYPVARIRLRQAFRTGPHLQSVVRVSMTPDGYRKDSGGTSVFIAWPVFSHYTETESAFLLHTGPEDALILPKSAVPEAMLEEVRRTLRESVGRTRHDEGPQGFPVAPPAPETTPEA